MATYGGANDVEKMNPLQDAARVTTTNKDAVFGDLTQDGPNYRSVGWLGTAGLMMKTQIGLGVLTFPHVFHTLGMIPGVLILVAVAIITTWSDYIVGVFKLNHREVYGIDDAGYLMLGRIGKEIFALAFLGQYVLASGAAMLSISISLNALSNHGACTAVFVAVTFIAVTFLSSIRTLGRVSWVAWVGLVGLLVSIFVVTIAVALKGPADVSEEDNWVADYKLFGNPTFAEATSAIGSIVFSYAGTGTFFAFVAEMKNPHHYMRSLALCQSTVTVVYLVVGIVVYYYCGSHVSSPALGSAGPLIKKIAYGIALPGLLASGIILAHVSSKYIFVRILRDSRHLAANTVTHWVTWLSCSIGVCTTAYVMASAIPGFNGLVSLAGAMFGTLMSFQPMGCMWLYDNWRSGRINPTKRWYFGVGWAVFVIVSGTFLMIAGSYGSIVEILNAYEKEGGIEALVLCG